MSKSETPDLKGQRDRFLAFAFAAADLLVEIDQHGRIAYATGASFGFDGRDNVPLDSRMFLDLFSKRDRALITSLRQRMKPGNRVGPVLVHLNETITDFGKAMLCGIVLPGAPDRAFVTLSKTTLASARDGVKAREESEEKDMSVEEFSKAAIDLLTASDMLGQKVGLTLVDVAGDAAFRARVGEGWGELQDHIQHVLRGYAADGRTATKFEDGRFGVMHDKTVSADLILGEVQNVSKTADPTGKGVQGAAQEVDVENDTLSDHELAKAFLYTVQTFAKSGKGFSVSSLQEGFDGFLSQNAQRISHFKQIINQRRFDLKFQPIVDLKTGEAAYYEALVRFDGAASPYESIVFIEDVGLSPELDLAICGRVLEFLLQPTTPKNVRISVNLSGVSVQNERFITKLRSKLEPHLKTDIPKRLVFEITESSEIQDLSNVNRFITALQDDGFKVSLDDFGAGSASFQYLHKLHVNGVKIDGVYVSNMLKSDRDLTMIRHLVSLCAELGVSVVAERVETAEEAKVLAEMGVQYGQGYYFAKPLDKPDYKKPK